MNVYRIWLTDNNDNIIYLNEDFDSRSEANKYVDEIINKYQDATIFEVNINENKVTYRMIDVIFSI